MQDPEDRDPIEDEKITWQVEHTGRGFEIVRFSDRNASDYVLSLQQSSAAIYEIPGTGAIWLGPSEDRMHLDLPMVRELHRLLGNWIESGSFTGTLEATP